MQGKLIVFEGTDGSGTATQSELLCQELTRRGVPYRKLTFPRYQEESSVLVRLYLGGAFGIVAFIISMITLSHLKVMESTILLLTGQLTAGILFDAFMFHNINLKKLLGILLVAAGIIWDNKISHMPEK